MLVTLGPLAFGAVDRVVQVALVGLLGLGMVVRPPKLGRWSAWSLGLYALIVLMLVGKELAPANWFGPTLWRTTMMQSFALPLPWTHHPELGRAIDGWLAGLVGVSFFFWARTLASDRDDRQRMAWIVLLGGVIVSAVSFATVGMGKEMIYGLRYTQGWVGFGPFPNRNHSACYFAMTAVIGAGCIARSAERRRWGWLVLGIALEVVQVLALLRTQSRGGLVAFAAGIVVFLALVLLRLRNRQAVAVSVAVGILLGGVALVAGQNTIGRLSGMGNAVDDSASSRRAIWASTVSMWKDAPLWGHGMGSFVSVFPLYQNVPSEEVRVKHPESSWLQWLAELGAIPLAFALAAAVTLVLRPALREMFRSHSGFFIRAAGLAAVSVLVVHAIFDVPGHRWGTAGLALVGWALACPVVTEGWKWPRLAGLAPVSVGIFWLLPLWWEWPGWSTFQLERLLAREASPQGLPLSEIEKGLRHFPLNAQLHLARGLWLVQARPPRNPAWREELRLGVRLVPNSVQICARLAEVCGPISPSVAYHYWQMALERTRRQRFEVFSQALAATGHLPTAVGVWKGYAETHPDLALFLSERLPGDEGKELFDLWWRERGATLDEVTEAEASTFLRLLPKWGTTEQLSTWMRQHRELGMQNARTWARLLRDKGANEKAWVLLKGSMAEPEFPTNRPAFSREQLEFRWRYVPADLVNARNYSQYLSIQGDSAGCDEVILTVARRPNAPRWFLDRAAYVKARQRQYADAVEFALRESSSEKAPAAASPTPQPGTHAAGGN